MAVWNSIYHIFRKWLDFWVFEKILQSLIEISRKYFLVIGVSRGGNVHDSEMAIKLLSKIALADNAFCSEDIRNFIFQEKAEVCIPDKSNAVVIHDFDQELYKSRNIVERFFQRIKNYRHIATRYDKLSDCFLNFIILSSVMIQS